MRAPVLTLALILAACGDSGDPAGNSAPTSSGSHLEPMPDSAANVAELQAPITNVAEPDAALPGIDAPPNSPAPRPAASPSPEPEREAAARVVQSYYANITKGDFARARAMWDDNGDASGLTVEQYAKRFDRFEEFRAEIGTPDRIDAGEGQRYVEVPVRVFGKLKEGGETFERNGIVTLHRTGDVEGATPRQRQWRVASAEVMPKPEDLKPAVAGGRPRIVNAHYQCANGARILARFDNEAGNVVLRRGYQRETLTEQRTGSGIWYKGEGAELRGKGQSATITLPGQSPLECSEIR